MEGLGKHERIVKVIRGGSVCLESGVVDISNANYLNSNYKERSDFLPDNSVPLSAYPTCISGAKVKKKLETIGVKPSKAFIGDTDTSIDNAKKKMAVERYHGSRFTGRLSHLVTARFGMYPKKIKDDGSFDADAEYKQPFDIDIQFKTGVDGVSTPYCAGISLHEHLLSPSRSFIFISKAYRIFLGQISYTDITLRECKLSSKGKKMVKALRDGQQLKDGLTTDKLLSFIYTQINSFEEPQAVYDFSSANVEQYGSPIAYGWHASFQIDSRQYQNFAVVLHTANAQNSEAVDTSLLKIKLKHTETLNEDDNTYVDQWSGNLTIETGGVFKPYRTDFTWIPKPPYEMEKKVYSNATVFYEDSFIYTFFTQSSDEPSVVHYVASERKYERKIHEFNGEWCGLPSPAKSGYVDEFLSKKGYYIKHGTGYVSNAVAHEGVYYERAMRYENISAGSVYDGADLPSLGICEGAFELKRFSESMGAWNFDDGDNPKVFTKRQTYTADVIDFSSNQSHTGTSYFVVQGNDAVFVLKNTRYTETFNERIAQGFGGHPIAVKEWSTYLNDDNELITVLTGTIGIKVKTHISITSGWESSKSYNNKPFYNLTVFMASPVMDGLKVMENVSTDDLSALWKSVTGAELPDLTINPLIECFEGVNISIHHGADGIVSNHHSQNMTANDRPVGWV